MTTERANRFPMSAWIAVMLIAMLFTTVTAWAQSVTSEVTDIIEIGADGIMGSSDIPTCTYNRFSLSQQIYTPQEIGEAGNIQSISFYNKTSNECTRYLDIYMVNTSKSSFTSNTDWVAVTSANRVFSGNVKFLKNAWTTITLTTPFLYDGQSNLLLVVDDNSGDDQDGGVTFDVYNATGQTLSVDQYYQADNPDPAAPSIIEDGQLMNVKNHIKLSITPTNEVFPPMPTGLTCTAITSKTATLQWTETGTATAWQICIDDDEANLINTTENPFTLTGLTKDQSYTVKVRAVDGAGHKSSWSDLISIAPTDKIRIGSGTDVNDKLPLYTYFKNSLSQQIYTASELGKAARFISIDFYCSQDVDNDQDITIYMVSTDKSSFDSETDWITVTDDNLVYSNQSTHLEKGWNTFALDNPFDYDGDSNVAIMVDAHSEDTQNGPAFLAYPAPSQAISYISDYHNFDPKNPLKEPRSTNVLLNSKNQIRILLTGPIVCPKPTALAYSNVTAHGASLSWNSEASAWQICINDDESHLINVTSTSYTLTGLNAETQYTVKVRTVCGTNEVSAWSREVSFTTLEACHALTGLSVTDLTSHSATLNWPDESDQYNVRYRRITGVNTLYSQSFESGIPNGWTTIDNDADGHNWQSLNSFASQYDYPWLANQAHGDHYAVCSPSSIGVSAPLETDNWLISPQLTLNGTLRFYTRCMSSGTLGYSDKSDLYEVLVSTTGTAPANFVVLQELSPAPIGMWDEVSINLSQFEGQSGYIAIRHHCSDKFLLVIDDFSISEYVFADWTTHNGITANSLAITNIYSQATYQWEVQKVCGGIDGLSKWTEDFFSTEHGEYTPTELSATNRTPTSVNLYWKSDANAWTISVTDVAKGNSYLVTIGLDDVTIDNGIVNYKLKGLKNSTVYSMRVNAIGDQNSDTEWSNSVSLTTLGAFPVPDNLTIAATTTTASVSWSGIGESYNVKYQYVDKNGGNVIFSDGFEDGLDGWRLIDCNSDSKINDNDSYSGSNAFMFSHYSHQYLISPELPADVSGATLQFYYRPSDYSWNNYLLDVGFSSTTNERKAFHFHNSYKAYNQQQWCSASLTIPEGTKYICWRSRTSNYDIYIDDIHITSVVKSLIVQEPSAIITGLTPGTTYTYQVQSLTDDLISDWSPLLTFNTLYDVILNNNSDNSAIIAANNSHTCQVTLSDRTLSKDGKWNTLCLPFTVSVLEGSPLEGATARPLTAANISGTTLNLTFGDPVTTLVAGTPYLIKWESGADIVNPVFTGVTIDLDSPSGAGGAITFNGTYDAMTFDAADPSTLLLSGNKLHYADSGDNLGACCAYFLVAPAGSLTDYVINLGNDEKLTGTFPQRGDANADGSISVTDIAVVVNCILQLDNTGGFSLYGADANGDGQVTVTDIGVIVDMILGTKF